MPLSRKDEKYLDWLTRTDVSIEDVATITDLRELLRKQLELRPREHLPYNAKQLEVLLKTAKFINEELTPLGIRPISVDYPWGLTTRYGIKGQPGLFGAAAVIRLLRRRI